jgi:Escherichia/Staphylococcus phage prohead protease
VKHKREFRIVPHAEIRVSRKGKKTGIEGYAAVFNQLSEDLGFFREMVMPGAFKDNLATNPDVRALFNHDSNLVLGRTRAKTLTLEEDSKGLHFDCTLPDTQAARDLLTSIERGDVDQCSFGFMVRKQKWSEEKNGDGDSLLVRELHAVDLFDVSPVTFPAYPQTSVDTRKLWPDGAPRDVLLIPRAFRQEEDEAGECACQCLHCASGECEECDNENCDDEACRAAGCPNQDAGDEPGDDVEENSGRIRIFMGELRGAVAFKKTPTSDADSWDGDAARGRLAKWASSDGSGDKDKINWSKYAQGFGWVDPDNKENFGGYKLPHHDVKDGKLVSVWGGVQGAMNALLGGRGGTNIPEGDRKAVYNHLASEYKLHGKDVPDFHAFLPDDAELRETLRRRVELARV